MACIEGSRSPLRTAVQRISNKVDLGIGIKRAGLSKFQILEDPEDTEFVQKLLEVCASVVYGCATPMT